ISKAIGLSNCSVSVVSLSLSAGFQKLSQFPSSICSAAPEELELLALIVAAETKLSSNIDSRVSVKAYRRSTSVGCSFPVRSGGIFNNNVQLRPTDFK